MKYEEDKCNIYSFHEDTKNNTVIGCLKGDYFSELDKRLDIKIDLFGNKSVFANNNIKKGLNFKQ